MKTDRTWVPKMGFYKKNMLIPAKSMNVNVYHEQKQNRAETTMSYYKSSLEENLPGTDD